MTETLRTVAVLGAGNMAGAIAQSLAGAGDVESIRLTTRTREPEWAGGLSHVEHRALSVDEGATAWALDGADAVILGVKPYQIVELCEEIAPLLGTDAVVISVAAGVRLEPMREALGEGERGAGVRVVRAMPNTPTAIGRGVTALAGEPADCAAAASLLAPTGLIEIVDESLVNAFAAVAGSGPAYAYAFVEALEAAAVSLGIPTEQATRVVTATMLGSMTYLDGSPHDAAELRRQVTSPGGSTAEALRVFGERDLNATVADALAAALARNEEMGK
ncbi:pyrroline-5-carboxylate reductase [Demequina sp. NBRC 110055]|uniref:pyrroline-5-carboxylate reductase n=1 Tax=Demequina sp. NBRC 110055 TaxID=1570344 RepID=UPI000A0632FC|nr:pyrroline-5-carboxylate reductase [Demequina sp. NBRC 110055]